MLCLPQKLLFFSFDLRLYAFEFDILPKIFAVFIYGVGTDVKLTQYNVYPYTYVRTSWSLNHEITWETWCYIIFIL